MAKEPPQKPAATPVDFPQVEPHELFPTNNIRHVITETAKLIERVDGLKGAVDKLDSSFEKALDKQASDTKERIAEIKSDVKETGVKVGNLKESIDSFRGAMRVFAGLYALALVLVAAFLAWYLKPDASAPGQAAVPPTGTAQPSAPQPSAPAAKISN